MNTLLEKKEKLSKKKIIYNSKRKLTIKLLNYNKTLQNNSKLKTNKKQAKYIVTDISFKDNFVKNTYFLHVLGTNCLFFLEL